MKSSLPVALSATFALFFPLIAEAATYIDTPSLTSSTVDVVVREAGTDIGSQSGIAITSGSASLSAEETAGVFSSLSLTGGSFTVADTSIALGGFLTGSSLNSTGLGFTILPSNFTLAPTATANTYVITGTLGLRADQGSAEVTGLITRDFATTPEDYSASLINSTIVITPDGGGGYTYDGSIRFSETPLVAASIYTVSVSSLNTINISGTLIPEPSTAILALSGFLMLVRRRR